MSHPAKANAATGMESPLRAASSLLEQTTRYTHAIGTLLDHFNTLTAGWEITGARLGDLGVPGKRT